MTKLHLLERIYNWLKSNGPASSDIVAGHVLGVGDANRSLVRGHLKCLVAEGRVVILEPGASPLRYEVARMLPPTVRLFPKRFGFEPATATRISAQLPSIYAKLRRQLARSNEQRQLLRNLKRNK